MMKTVKEKLELLEKIAYYFNKENVEWALGASMLLYFKGITTEFHDIDLMVSTDDAKKVKDILLGMGKIQESNQNQDSIYRTKIFMEFVIDDIDVDVMVGLAIIYEGKLYDCSLSKDQIVEKIKLGKELVPLQSPQLWCKYYQLMGRKEKVKMIERYLLKTSRRIPHLSISLGGVSRLFCFLVFLYIFLSLLHWYLKQN